MEWSVEHHANNYSVLTLTLDPCVDQKIRTVYFMNVNMLNGTLQV